jgi:hypothetical protein
MINYEDILTRAIINKKNKPKSELVVKALLLAEKVNHQQKIKYQLPELFGNWRLYFITGTKTSRQKWGKLLGAGFYLPPLLKITLNYSKNQTDQVDKAQGKITNQVQVGLVEFSLTGPIKYIPNKNILGFDFTHLTMSILGTKIYQTDVRGGVKSHSDFYQTSIKQQAFFSYFYVTESLIAARGRGGGLALWKKEPT